MGLFGGNVPEPHSCQTCDELRAAVLRSERQIARLQGYILRMKLAGGTPGPKGPKSGAPAPADPIGVAIEQYVASYPTSQRGDLTRHLRSTATALRQQGQSVEDVVESIRAGQRETQQRGD